MPGAFGCITSDAALKTKLQKPRGIRTGNGTGTDRATCTQYVIRTARGWSWLTLVAPSLIIEARWPVPRPRARAPGLPVSVPLRTRRLPAVATRG